MPDAHSGYEIRRFRPGDATGVKDVILPIQTAEFGVPITFEDQPDLTDIPGFYQKGTGDFWVAVAASGEIVGTISLLDIGAGEGALRKMFVKAEWRGKDKQVAQALLTALLTHARAKGLSAVFLGTTDLFHAAHRFYEKNGFTRLQPDALPATFPRMKVDTRFYRILV